MENVKQLTVPTPFQIGDVHIYLIEDDAISLVDAGVRTREAWRSIERQLNGLGFQPSDVDQIFLTHHHPDHIGLIEEFPKADVIAHRYVDPWIRQDKNFLAKYEQYYLELLTQTGVPELLRQGIDDLQTLLFYSGKGKLGSFIKDGDVLPGHNDWRVVETKGHAQSHLAFFREKDGLFIGGDHLLQNTSPNPIIEAPYDNQVNREQPLLQYRDNLKKCLHLDITNVLPGHGKIFSEVTSYVKHQLKAQENRASRVLEWLKQERLTPFEISKRLFPRHYEQQLQLTMSETIGQLDYLTKYDKVYYEEIDGIVEYRAK